MKHGFTHLLQLRVARGVVADHHDVVGWLRHCPQEAAEPLMAVLLPEGSSPPLPVLQSTLADACMRKTLL